MVVGYGGGVLKLVNLFSFVISEDMKAQFLLLVCGMSLFSCGNNSGVHTDANQILTNVEIVKDSTIPNQNLISLLAKDWISVSRMIDGKEIEIKGVYALRLNRDSTFTSFYKPINLKKGHWILNNDSTFTLFMKATDEYKIIEVSDSTLKITAMWDNTIYTFMNVK